MKITIITVCMNSVNTIEKTIRSVIEQEYSDLEYIVIDGGSTDGTLEVLRQYESYIDKWISEPDNGIHDAMNKGIELSTGEVIAFLNSDDWYEKDAIKIVENAFMEGEFDCVCCDNYVVKKDGSKVYYNAVGKPFEDLYFRMIYFHSAIFCRKKFFKRKENFDLKYKIAADYDWFLKVAKLGIKVSKVRQPIFTFYYGGISSVKEIDCAREAKYIALKHLTGDKEQYKEKIEKRFCEIVLNATDSATVRTELINILGEDKTNILWGAGTRGRECIKWFKDLEISVEAIIDNDQSIWGQYLQNIKVCSSDILKGISCNVIITPDRYSDDIRNITEKIGGTSVHIFELIPLCMMIVCNLENGNTGTQIEMDI